MKRSWPVYDAHERVRCFNCARKFPPGVEPRATDNPIGRGHWARTCEACMVATFYDLKPEVKAVKEGR